MWICTRQLWFVCKAAELDTAVCASVSWRIPVTWWVTIHIGHHPYRYLRDYCKLVPSGLSCICHTVHAYICLLYCYVT